MAAAMKLASVIASKSPVAIQGSKINLNFSRDHTVDESLEYMVSFNFPYLHSIPHFSQTTWNMAMLQTEDIPKSIQAQMTKERPTFSKL